MVTTSPHEPLFLSLTSAESGFSFEPGFQLLDIFSTVSTQTRHPEPIFTVDIPLGQELNKAAGFLTQGVPPPRAL
jgi:hypothetical protein